MDQLRNMWRTTRIVGLILPAAPIMLVVVILVIQMQGQLEPQEVEAALPIALVVVSLVELVLIVVIRRILMGGMALAGPNEAMVSRAEPVSTEEAVAALNRAALRYYKGTIVGMALGMSIAIYGFVLAYLMAAPMLLFPFALVGMAAMLVQMPRWSSLLSLVEPEVVATVRRERIQP